MSVILGIAGAARNAAVALCDDGRVVAACEQERLTRTRRVGLRKGESPIETLETVLRLGGRGKTDVSAYAVAEAGIEFPCGVRVERLDHHHGHAATAFYTSPFEDAVVLVCDRHGVPELTVWRADSSGIKREDFSWSGPGLASLYLEATEALGFTGPGDEHRLEALAHVAPRSTEPVPVLSRYLGDGLEVSSHFKSLIASLLASNGHEGALTHRARVAEATQRHLGNLLLEILRDIKNRFGGRNLCLGGGLFYNTYFNTLVEQSGGYDRTFVPVNPGNAGVAIGAAVAVAWHEGEVTRNGPLSAFLGPEFQMDEIKATLDNCKLSYDYVRDGQLIERTTAALAKGKLVGWFQGRMEWGARALGNRSILASPIAPYVLENLNAFLKQRAPHRSYSVSVCAEDAPRYFRGPASSHFMEYEHEVIEPDALRTLLPLGATGLRLQTVPGSMGLFHTLLKAFGDVTKVPILVNTSFNGFNEPIVCTPRDAVRVFYGTGLDMAVIGNFVLQK